jgi:acyl-CoA thioester hydrolase
VTRAVWSAPVRYAECDQQGIVFNAHYLTWADEAVLPWLASVGTPYPALLARGLDTRVVSSTLDWTAPARYGDLVEVDAALDRLGRTSFTVAFDVRVGERACCRVRTTYVLVGTDGRPVPVPEDLRTAWTQV